MKIKKIVEVLVDKYKTRNPYEIAEELGILVQKNPLGKIHGYYLFYSGIKCICVNSEIQDLEKEYMVAAHELGHAVMHEEERCMFFEHTIYDKDKYEVQANKFAAELLIPDSIIYDNPGMTKLQIARINGYSEQLIGLKKI